MSAFFAKKYNLDKFTSQSFLNDEDYFYNKYGIEKGLLNHTDIEWETDYYAIESLIETRPDVKKHIHSSTIKQLQRKQKYFQQRRTDIENSTGKENNNGQ